MKTQEVVADLLVAAVMKTFVAVWGLVLSLTARRLGRANQEAFEQDSEVCMSENEAPLTPPNGRVVSVS